MKKYFFIACLCIGMNSLSYAQTAHLKTSNNNLWLVYNGDHKISDQWGVHLEAQIRRADFGQHWQQLLLRAGLNYYLNPNVFVSAGYGFIQTHPYGDFPVKATYPEHRIWEQLQIKTPLNRIEWISRFRLEQRFSKSPVLDTTTKIYAPGDAVYTNRIRYMNRFSLPFHGKVIRDHSIFLTAYDELFVNFGKHVSVNYLDQNRAFIGIGYKLPRLGRLEIGYMEQTILKSSYASSITTIKQENNHTIQVAFNANMDFYKKKK